jgi:hypothetical protein
MRFLDVWGFVHKSDTGGVGRVVSIIVQGQPGSALEHQPIYIAAV